MTVAIDTSTRIMARLHPEMNGRGLNIYNPYFDRGSVNALYVLFHNPDPRPLVEGIRSLGLPGAVIAGSFEKDPRVVELLDDLHPLSRRLGTVGCLVCKEGKVWGVYQGAFGLLESLTRLTDLSDKRLVILGAGNVVRGLLLLMEMDQRVPREIVIYNRTVARAERLANEFPFVQSVGSLDDMLQHAQGDVFLNATYIGSPWNGGQEFVFPDRFVARFNYLADVTFVPLRPQLIQVSERLGKRVSPGHRMFLHQAGYVLKAVLGVDVQEDLFSDIMIRDFEVNWS